MTSSDGTNYTCNMNSALFELWFTEVLLKLLPAGSIIILDNASWHRKKVLIALAGDEVVDKIKQELPNIYKYVDREQGLDMRKRGYLSRGSTNQRINI